MIIVIKIVPLKKENYLQTHHHQLYLLLDSSDGFAEEKSELRKKITNTSTLG